MTDPTFFLRAGSTEQPAKGTPGNVLTFQSDGKVGGEPPAAGAVSSVFTRSGAVAAEVNDYAASLIDNDSGVAGATVKDALDALLAAIAAISGGTAKTVQVPVGAGGGPFGAIVVVVDVTGIFDGMNPATQAAFASCGDFPGAGNPFVTQCQITGAAELTFVLFNGSALATGAANLPVAVMLATLDP